MPNSKSNDFCTSLTILCCVILFKGILVLARANKVLETLSLPGDRSQLGEDSDEIVLDFSQFQVYITKVYQYECTNIQPISESGKLE